MSSHQASRYELKYLVDESTAEAIRERVGMYLRPDEHAKLDSIGYRVQSLYLDSQVLTCYSQTVHGIKNRFKLRIRFYDELPDSPVFLEVKRRVTQVIQKKRAKIDRASAELLLRGSPPDVGMLLEDNARERDALLTFCQLKDEVRATGRIYVDYYREAFQCGGANHYRVTFDRLVRGSKYDVRKGLHLPQRSSMAEIPGVILEMKYYNEPARWMIDIARQYQLQRTSVPKYVECIDALEPAAHLVAGVMN